jgi:hypothetical protein
MHQLLYNLVKDILDGDIIDLLESLFVLTLSILLYSLSILDDKAYTLLLLEHFYIRLVFIEKIGDEFVHFFVMA